MNLYEISAEYQKNFLEIADLDLPEEVINDTLEAIQGDVESKSIAVASYKKNLDAEAQAIKDAIKNMKARQAAIENHAARLNNYLKSNMEACGINEITCPYFKLKIKKNTPSVVIKDESLIPDEFKETVETVKIDKAGIKKAGGCEGVEIANGTRLDIK